MKKLALVSLILLAGLGVTNGQKYSVQAGLNIANGIFTLGNATLNDAPLIGFNAGVTGTIQLAGPLHLNGGLIYSQKGTHFEVTIINTFPGKMSIEYLEVPLNLRLQREVGPVTVFVQAGGYGAYALANKVDYETSGVNDYTFDWGTDEDTMNRFDYGLNAGAGVGYSSFELLVNYSTGMINVYNEIEGIPQTIKNKVLSFSALFNF